MIQLSGEYNNAKVYTDTIEPEAITQIIDICNQKAFEGSKIRIMPDVHAGKGCTIGTTMTLMNKVVPNLVGVDIGCGMKVIKIGKVDIDYELLDKNINSYIPSGYSVRAVRHKFTDRIDLHKLYCYDGIKENRALLSIGTLGGGNHFIEIDVNEWGEKYLVIHSGSRNLGKEVAIFYQNKAYEQLTTKFNKTVRTEIINRLKSEGRNKDIQSELEKLTIQNISKEFAYCEGELFKQYIHDMKIIQEYAVWNRNAMADVILDSMNIYPIEEFTTIHNYIDTDNMILRKGAVSAQDGEKLIIPINMRDGSLICTGKGNPDWNYSAPHGAGRIMSRTKARENVSLEEFKKSMAGIYTTSVNTATIDESPMAYKSIDEILTNIKDTVEVDELVKPTYNFKASD